MPQAITFPQFPSVTVYDDNGEEEDAVIGDIAEQYLRTFFSVSVADETFGLRDKDGSFTLGTRKQK